MTGSNQTALMSCTPAHLIENIAQVFKHCFATHTRNAIHLKNTKANANQDSFSCLRVPVGSCLGCGGAELFISAG